MKKFVLVGLICVVVLGIILAYLLYSNLDSIVAEAIRTWGPEVTGTKVSVEKVQLDLQAGSGSIEGFSIANPPGFPDSPMIGFGEFTLGIDYSTIGANPIVINNLVIDSPNIHYIKPAEGKGNLDILKDNLESFGKKPSGTEPTTPKGPPRKFIIRKMEIRSSHVKAEVSGLKAPIETTLPSLTFENLGGNDGASPAEIGKTILTKLADASINSIAKEKITDLLGEKIGEENARKVKGLLDRVLK